VGLLFREQGKQRAQRCFLAFCNAAWRSAQSNPMGWCAVLWRNALWRSVFCSVF
jgi:hypothetical protein